MTPVHRTPCSFVGGVCCRAVSVVFCRQSATIIYERYFYAASFVIIMAAIRPDKMRRKKHWKPKKSMTGTIRQKVSIFLQIYNFREGGYIWDSWLFLWQVFYLDRLLLIIYGQVKKIITSFTTCGGSFIMAP